VALLAGFGTLLWPHLSLQSHLAVFSRHSASSSRRSAPSMARPPGLVQASSLERVRRLLPGRRTTRVGSQDLLSLLNAIAPALDAGIGPASALRIVAEARADSGHLDPLTELAAETAAAAAQGVLLAPLWRRAAESTNSAELLLLAHAWSLTEDMGVPLASAVRTTAGLLEARMAHEQRLASAVAGARATVNLLTILPVGGPLLAIVLGIKPAELYGGSGLTQCSLVIGLSLAVVGRLWVRRMIRAVARGPVIA
jgi:tight adherence protein B